MMNEEEEEEGEGDDDNDDLKRQPAPENAESPKGTGH